MNQNSRRTTLDRLIAIAEEDLQKMHSNQKLELVYDPEETVVVNSDDPILLFLLERCR